MKRIGLVAGNISEGLSYQRLHLPFRHLRDEYDFKCFDLGDMRNSDCFYLDAIIMCHSWSPQHYELIERARHWYGIKVIADIDDLLHNLPADHEDYSKVVPYQRVAHVLQAADIVTVSTEYLKHAYGHLNKNIHVIENTIDYRLKKTYEPAFKPHKNAFVVGWTGGQSHRSDQFQLVPGLSSFLRKHPEARAYFHVLCPQTMLNEFGAQIHFEAPPVYFLDYPGVAAAYPFDVCCVPLIAHPFNDAKSDLRLLDMAVNEIPLIVSPRSDFIKHAERGICLYAEDNSTDYKSWEEQIQWAFDHPDELKEMGRRAKEYVYAERQSEIAANKYRDILRSIL